MRGLIEAIGRSIENRVGLERIIPPEVLAREVFFHCPLSTTELRDKPLFGVISRATLRQGWPQISPFGGISLLYLISRAEQPKWVTSPSKSKYEPGYDLRPEDFALNQPILEEYEELASLWIKHRAEFALREYVDNIPLEDVRYLPAGFLIAGISVREEDLMYVKPQRLYIPKKISFIPSIPTQGVTERSIMKAIKIATSNI